MCSRTLVHMFSSCMYRQAIHSCDRRRFDGPVSHMRWNMKWEVIHNPLVYQHSCPDASIGKVVEATARRQKIKIQKKVGTSKIIIYIFNSMCVLCMNKIQCAFELDFIDPAVWSDHIHDTHTNATENKKYKLKQHEEGEANKKGTVFFFIVAAMAAGGRLNRSDEILWRCCRHGRCRCRRQHRCWPFTHFDAQKFYELARLLYPMDPHTLQFFEKKIYFSVW